MKFTNIADLTTAPAVPARTKGLLNLWTIVESLARKDINVNDFNCDRPSTMSWAAQEGSETIIPLLLRHDDIVPDATDTFGRTPLI
ncbi:hypothetical protein N7517_001544 [Penicillium concentricum]|uniref:Ankyrin n=1 Tax=Penicillium concentricum TaxID=293559 RepID=A0A9W9VIM4_9EURO|nr:uncharacterized protein N7517_001544 [Penicillium concentricum]KAJ5383633.1 hypothetical protein N7517_001544 [Penicillium concentricum]